MDNPPSVHDTLRTMNKFKENIREKFLDGGRIRCVQKSGQEADANNYNEECQETSLGTKVYFMDGVLKEFVRKKKCT